MTRFSLRTRLTILVAVAALITLGVLTTGFNLLLRSNLDADANRVLQARTAAALEGLALENGSIRVKESPDQGVPDSLVWVYAGPRTIERPLAAVPVQRLADSLSADAPASAENGQFDVRLHAVPVMQGGQRLGTVVAALSLEPYEHSASRALIDSLIYAALALALVLVATRVVVTRALKPVAQMTSEAAVWSEHDLDHRFNVGEPRDELTRLAATFDGMLERLASSLRHEQLLSAELSHELRTPLAAIVTEAELALRRDRGSEQYREALREIRSRAAQMQRTLETLLAASRAEAAGNQATADAEEAAAQALAAYESIARGRDLELRLEPVTQGLTVDVDTDTTERILAPLIENACRYSRRRVELSIRQDGDAVEFQVSDDGPGIPDGDRERIFEPGFRGRQNGSDHEGAGLGLPLARRLARAIGGDVHAESSDSGALLMARVPQSRPA